MVALWTIYDDLIDAIMTKIRAMARWTTSNSGFGPKDPGTNEPTDNLWLIPMPFVVEEEFLGGDFAPIIPFRIFIDHWDETSADYETGQKAAMQYACEVLDALIASPRTYGSYGYNISNIDLNPIDEDEGMFALFRASLGFAMRITRY
jgi:hypothetical protein